MSQHYESDSPNSSTSSTSGMSYDISEDESVLGSEDVDAREDAEVSDHVLDYSVFVEIAEPSCPFLWPLRGLPHVLHTGRLLCFCLGGFNIC